MQRRRAPVFFSLLFLAPSSCFGQATMTKALSGYIREEGSSHVIASVRVDMQSPSGNPISSTFSDSNGAYEFDNISGGDCYLMAQHAGYTTTRELVQPQGSPHFFKDLYLRPASDESEPKSIDPVSQHELSIPPKARDAFEKGVQLVVEKSDYRGAVSQFARAIAKYPSYYEAYAAMGLAQNKIGDAAAAEASLRKSIELSAEKYPQALIDLASMFNSEKRFSDAEPLLRKVIALDASSWRGQFELAAALSGLQRFGDALVSASAARDLKPDNPQIYLLLYNLHIRTDDFPAALRDTENYLKLVPDGAAADRVRKMQEQVKKAVQSSGGDPGPSSDATPVAAPFGSSINPAAPVPAASSNFAVLLFLFL
jgi:tetratricopeptide (TPR) repeat protein